MSGLEALAEVSTNHGLHLGMQNDYLARDPEYLGSHGGGIERQQTIPHDLSQYDSGGTQQQADLLDEGFSGINEFGFPETTRASSQLQLAALHALIPNSTIAHDYLRRSSPARPGDDLVDYSHGEVPTIDERYSRHAPPVEEAENSPSPGDDLVDYSHGQAPASEDDHSRQVLPEVNTNLLRDYESLRLAAPVLPPRTSTQPERSQTRPTGDHESNEKPAETSPPTGVPLELVSDRLQEFGRPPVPVAERSQTYHDQHIFESQMPQFQVWHPEGTSSATSKKVRGAFAADRRTAVKEVRKKGACLRCRMLKKSCDAGDPCGECSKLERARMWKGQCVRTRLSHTFNVFSSGLFSFLARLAWEDAMVSATMVTEPGRIEASYYPFSGLYMTFPRLRTAEFNHRPTQLLINPDEESAPPSSTFRINFSYYGSQLLSLYYKNPAKPLLPMSRFMHETIKVALTMNSRVLIARALDLWMCVTMLAAPPEQLLTAQNPNLPPINSPVDASQHPAGERIDNSLIYLQLRRKLENTADTHFKAAMAEIEKALIQRKQADNFETFIGTIVLLRCLEQICYLYKGLDHLVDPSHPRKGVLYGSGNQWPLDNPPSHFWQQGEQFSDLLCSMLRLRRVPPNFIVVDGKLATEDEPKVVREWFEAVQLDVAGIRAATERAVEDEDGSAWELRWIGKIFEVFEQRVVVSGKVVGRADYRKGRF